MPEDASSVADELLDLETQTREASPTAKQMLAVGVVFEGGLAVLAVALGWLFARPLWQTIAWDRDAIMWGFISTIPMVVLLLSIEHWPVGPLRDLKRVCDETLVPLFSNCRWWHFAVISILAGLGEELLFRGLIQTSLVDWLGTWPGIVAAGLLFGLAHPMSKAYIVAAAVIGIYLGWLFVATGNLLTPIITHALYDMVALVYLSRTTGTSSTAA